MADIKTLLFVTPSLSDGGAQRVVTVLATELSQMGYNVYVWVHFKKNREYTVGKKVKVFYDSEQEDTNKRNIARSVKKVMRLRKLVREIKPDFIVPFLESANIHTYFSTRLMHVRFISTIRNNPNMRSRWRKFIGDYIALHSTALYAQTEEQKDYYKQKIREKTFVLPNPVNSSFICKTYNFNLEKCKFIAVGRLTKQKNYPLLIRAFDVVKRDYPDVKLSICGDGEDKNELLNLTHELNLDSSVIFEGRIDNVEGKLKTCDVYILTSDFEGMPNALMEAMAIGMPVISTDCPTGPSNLITDRSNGLLVKINSEKELSDAMIYCIENPDAAASFGRKANEYMKANFQPSYIAERFINELKKFI